MLGGARPDRLTPESRYSTMPINAIHLVEKESRKVKELEKFPPNPRQPRRWLRFFATFPCNLIVLSQGKCSLNMLAHR